MITIRPSSATGQGPTPQENASQPEDHKRRIPLVWIPVTLTVGLLIAAIYLGGRIVTAHPHEKPAAATVNAAPHTPPPQSAPLQPAPAQAPPVQATASIEAAPARVEPSVEPSAEPEVKIEVRGVPKPASKLVAPEPSTIGRSASPNPATETVDDAVPMITPQTGDRYIQVGALNLEATRRFVKHLRSEKLDPHVAPGPKPELLRVLIGPFNDRDALTEEQNQLHARGIDTFVRKY